MFLAPCWTRQGVESNTDPALTELSLWVQTRHHQKFTQMLTCCCNKCWEEVHRPESKVKERESVRARRSGTYVEIQERATLRREMSSSNWGIAESVSRASPHLSLDYFRKPGGTKVQTAALQKKKGEVSSAWLTHGSRPCQEFYLYLKSLGSIQNITCWNVQWVT